MSFRLFTIFVVLFFIQATFARPLDSTSKSVDSSQESKDINCLKTKACVELLLNTAENMLKFGNQFGAKAADISRQLLKDENLLANDKPQVLEFKEKINEFVEAYDGNKDANDIWNILVPFLDNLKEYAEPPKDKITPETTFISELYKKYYEKSLETEFIEPFVGILETFKDKFEESKQSFDKPLLAWFDKFKTLTDFEEKLDAYGEFLKLVKS